MLSLLSIITSFHLSLSLSRPLTSLFFLLSLSCIHCVLNHHHTSHNILLQHTSLQSINQSISLLTMTLFSFLFLLFIVLIIPHYYWQFLIIFGVTIPQNTLTHTNPLIHVSSSTLFAIIIIILLTNRLSTQHFTNDCTCLPNKGDHYACAQ